MNTSPRPELDWERLLLIAGGHTAFQLLWAGLELGLYDKLAKRPGMSLDEVAEALGLARQPARILLIGLTALGVVRLDEGRYRNAALVEERLVPGKPGYAGAILGWQAHIVYPGMADFVESLKQNKNIGLERFPGSEPTLYQRLAHAPLLEKIFQDSMSGLSKQANTFLPGAVDFGRYQHVVDAGGGDGTNAVAIATRHPGVRASVFDAPSVCDIAERNIEAARLSDRVSTWRGDFFVDPLPPGTDCVTFCHILTIFSMEKNRALLQRMHDQLPDRGAVVVFNMMGADDDTGPLSTALGSPYFLAIATGEGMLHARSEYEAACKAVGFREVIRVQGTLPLDHGIVVAIK